MLVATFVIISYFVLLSILTVYAFHRYIMVYLFQKHRNDEKKQVKEFTELPTVTIQLPVYNELYVIERLIKSICQIEYPREKLHIQILDDSTDETIYLAERITKEARQEGYDIEYLHRRNREGFKAGALQAGMETAKGEFIAIFDADFIPPNDFLIKTIHSFTDPQVAVVQSRWGHINSDYSLLTEIQALMLDGHFVVEHIARNRSGRFLNFNGTGGMWRKQAIIDSGGWQSNTLTEDLDLSYRAQMRGWKFVYLPDIVSDAELPVDMDAFKRQQYRWTKGAIQTGRKLLFTLLKSKLPWWIKVEGFFHLTNNVSYFLMLLLSILMFPSMIFRFNLGWYDMMYFDLPIFCLATFSIGAFYIFSAKEIYPDWKKKIKYIPCLMALGYGLCVSNGKAVAEAMTNVPSEFVRTPKYMIEKENKKLMPKGYRSKKGFTAWWEILFGMYYAYAIYFCIDYDLIAAVPFLALFAFGFWYVGLYTLWQNRDQWLNVRVKTAFQNT
ncbi:MAG: glycosyl transferase family 2 [Candidatus Fischerbacteria bacterium RBG_13_37_8]|uniref:Glycosyl transferase family 2 n=1 Tax=Candidatus Fischerbacteria bacterium RBG_13_37_8 TaxID=1817863 RepID=A0A1F5VNH6_9BACT|nr:MAG: glycosyl transferase family 2 [Candidatus Fischerbacteria bacterium RBG_13_37_8]